MTQRSAVQPTRAYVYNDPGNSVDPSGLFLNLVAGGLISGGIELASQMLLEGKSLGCVDWGGVALEAATGCNPFAKWKKLSNIVEGAQCVLGNSFVAGTLVHTDQGLKLIEEIKIGEKVKSFNERTSQTSDEPVLELIRHDGTFQLVKVTLDSGESLEATAGHPFYIQGKGWNVAANLKVGDALRLHNGVTLVIKTVETSTRFAHVYNFAVASNANYFVGKDGVLVHNAGCRAPEHYGGRRTESKFLDSFEKYLGRGYKEESPGRWVSPDGMRQMRYGHHETKNYPRNHHGHYEAYDSSYHQGGNVIENTVVDIIPVP